MAAVRAAACDGGRVALPRDRRVPRKKDDQHCRVSAEVGLQNPKRRLETRTPDRAGARPYRRFALPAAYIFLILLPEFMVPVGLDQAFQLRDRQPEPPAKLALGYVLGPAPIAYNGNARDNIRTVENRCFD
jgi:hypothetical protein